MPDNYDTYTGPTPTIYETDITQNLCIKVEKIKNLHQILENDKKGLIIVDLFSTIFKLELDQDISKVCAKFQRVSIVWFGNFRTENQVPSLTRFPLLSELALVY